MSSVLLTGATGFLGRAVAREAASRGWRVHALARPTSDRSVLEGLRVVWHEGDLRDETSLRGAFAAARRFAGDDPLDVVHLAALISYRTRDADLAREVNVEGTRRALRAAMLAGIRRFVHVSSIVTVAHAEGSNPTNEDAEFNAARLGSHYVDTKREAEDLVLAAAGELDVVVVNPGAVFGPAVPGSNSAHFLQRAAEGSVRLAPPGSLSVVGVDDTAAGTMLALTRGQRGRRYLLCESTWSLRAVLEEVARLAGARPPLGTVPPALWSLVPPLLSAVDRVRPLDRLTPQAARMLAVRWDADASRAREELGWSPRPFREVLARALEETGRLRDTSTHPVGSSA